MAEQHFVVQGALCNCQFGASPDKLKVSGTDREYINDIDGAQKLIGSSVDLGQPFEAKTFGSCSVTRSSCSPAVTQWQDFYKNVTLTNGGKILTEKSKAICSVGGTPCISFTTHGQTAEVTQQQVNKVTAGAMSALNPLAAKPEAGKEIPKIKQIQVDVAGRKEPLSEKSSSGKSAITTVKLAVNEQAGFKVIAYYNAAKADKSKVNWKLIKAHGFQGESESYIGQGEQFSLSFEEPGNYRILAYGNEATQNDASCSIDITVLVNKLKTEFTTDASTTRSASGGLRVRRGSPVTLKAAYELEPTADDRKRVYMQVTDEGGNIVAGPTAEGTDQITFTAANTGNNYTVTAVMKATEQSEEQVVTKTFRSENNSVATVSSTPNVEVIRPGTAMSFNASGMAYPGAATAEEAGMVKWQLNGKPVGSGAQLRLDGSHFTRPGSYVVEAYVSSANAWNANAAKPSKANEGDDWRFEVKKNEIVSIAEEKGLTQWIVGKRYNIVAKTAMAYDQRLDGNITWTPANGSGLRLGGVYAPQAGNIRVTATLGGKTMQLMINAAFAAIERWCFTDAQGVYKAEAGWKETVNVVLKSPLAAGESVNIHLLEFDSATDINYIKDLGNVTFNSNGEAKVSFNTDDIKATLKALNFEGKFYDLLFGVLKKDSGISFADVKTLNSNGKTFVFPKKDSNQTDRETGKYLYISDKPDIVSVRYLDGGGHRIYKVLHYGDKVRMHVQTRNMAKTRVKMSIYLNVATGEDKLVMADKEFTVRDDETILIDIDTNVLKQQIAENQRKNIAMFYVVLKEADGDRFAYPKDLAMSQTIDTKKLSFYHHLKLSENTENVNKQATANAPVVLGEPLEAPGSSTGKCVCKEYDLVWGSKVSCAFRKKVVEISAALWGEEKKIEMANGLMAVMKVETGGSFKAHQIMGKALIPLESMKRDDFKQYNPNTDKTNSRAVGLIQFTQTALEDLGDFTAGSGMDALNDVKLNYAKMGEIKQLDKVKAYFELGGANTKIKTAEDIYLHVFAPVGVNKPEDYVLYEKSDKDPKDRTAKEAASHKNYNANSTVDTENKGKTTTGGDGKIQRSEILGRYRSSYAGGVGFKSIRGCVAITESAAKVDGIVTYKVFQDGQIERYVPKVIKPEYLKKYQYVYIDKSNKEHVIGLFNFNTVKNIYGATYGGATVDLIDFKELNNYASGDVKFRVAVNTSRYYVNDKTLAALIGAMFENGYEDYTFNGFSNAKGESVGGSKSHKNGYNGDLRYLRKDKSGLKMDLFSSAETGDVCGWKGLDVDRQNKFNDALHKFGWKSMLSQTYDKNKLLNHATNDKDSNHNDHLHVQGFKPDFKEIKE